MSSLTHEHSKKTARNNVFDTAYYCNGVFAPPPLIQRVKWTHRCVQRLICTTDDVLALLAEYFRRPVWKIYMISPCYYFIKRSVASPDRKSLIFIFESTTTDHLFWATLSIRLLRPETFGSSFAVRRSQLMPRRLHYSGCASPFLPF